MSVKEEVIYRAVDKGWDRELPITLITYENGCMDIHRQTGPSFEEHMAEADKILLSRGLKRDENDEKMLGPSGLYQKVIKA